MSPAVINISYRFELTSNAKEKVLADLYGYLKNSITSEVNFMQSMRPGQAKEFQFLDYSLQARISQDLHLTSQSFLHKKEVPALKDETGFFILDKHSITVRVRNGLFETDALSFDLILTTSPQLLLGTMADKLILGVTNEKGVQTGAMFVKHTPDIWFNSYKPV